MPSATPSPAITRLDARDPAVRRAAVAELAADLAAGRLPRPARREWLNCHCHSTYSYNGYGASPSRLVWEAVQRGLSLVGLVDFDVLDGVDEFHAAGRAFGLRTTACIETRAYVADLATAEINSPGEPGVTYHMGAGFVQGKVRDAAFLRDLASRARARNLAVVAAVNRFLAPVQLDYERDAVALTPQGNVTERHLCQAYREVAEQRFPVATERVAFWTGKLGQDVSAVIGNPAKLEAVIRAKTMKQGGVGYQQPDSASFPRIEAMNAWIRAEGAWPMLAWLDGTRGGEVDPDRLLDLHLSLGTRAVAIIPDRNWNFPDAAERARKSALLHRFVAACEARHLPILVGTELNAPGLKWVDDFDAPELAPVVDAFRRGAETVFGFQVAARCGEPELADRAAANARCATLAGTAAALP